MSTTQWYWMLPPIRWQAQLRVKVLPEDSASFFCFTSSERGCSPKICLESLVELTRYGCYFQFFSYQFLESWTWLGHDSWCDLLDSLLLVSHVASKNDHGWTKICLVVLERTAWSSSSLTDEVALRCTLSWQERIYLCCFPWLHRWRLWWYLPLLWKSNAWSFYNQSSLTVICGFLTTCLLRWWWSRTLL